MFTDDRLRADGETFELFGRRMTLYDLSDTLRNATSANEPNPHEIVYLDHLDNIEAGRTTYGVGAEHWRDGKAWAYEKVSATTHSGTHVDAPYHYAPTSGGKPARTIDEVPLRWCCGPGVVLDMTGIDRVRGITVDDVRRELDRIEYEISPLDVVLVRTDASRHFGTPGYHLWGPGLRRSATEWLVGRGVRLIGIDAWGLDRPFDVMADEARAGHTAQLWESHYFGAEQEYLQIERLTNLAALPRPHGFFVSAFPYKIERASAGWTRVVAMVEEPESTDPQQEQTA